ncbi:MAG TPA: response regulator [Chloroflexi bacterium]|nr:response regulator [Chloroflexota bacterium]
MLSEKDQSLHVLLVEDSRTNRLILTASLEQAGCLVKAAQNGQEALHLLRDGAFDLVLMDVFMPHMDGLEATRAIRQSEPADGRRMPIIGLTATNTPEQRDLCLAAGMDACMSKPLDTDGLFAVIAPFISVEREEITWSEANGPDMPVDLRGALRAVDGDVELLRDVIALFLEEYPAHLTELTSALTKQDAGGVEGAAYRLKGILDNVGARVARDLAEQLEMMGEKRQLDTWEDVWAELDLEISSVLRFFEALDVET